MKIIVKTCDALLKVSKELEERKFKKLFDGIYSKSYVTDSGFVIRIFVE